MEVSGEKHNWTNAVLSLCSVYTLSDHLRITNTWGVNAHSRILLCIDGGMQAGKEGQCMQRSGGSAQCFALE